MASTDVFETLKTRPMSRAQIMTVAVGVLLVVLDGYDIALTSFSSPYIAEGFNIKPTELGMVGSGALVGLFIGACIVSPFGDKYGRRSTVIFGSVLGTIGMIFSAQAPTVEALIVGRIITGTGVGTMIAAVAIIFSEYVSRRAYAFVMALYAAGIPLGTYLGSKFVGPFAADHGWQIGFEIGVWTTAACIPLTIFFMPESLAYLATSRRKGALERFNKTLKRIGMDPVDELPVADNLREVKYPWGEVFKGNLLIRTLLSATAYFMFMLTFYFATNWAPKYLADVTGDRLQAAALMNSFSIGGLIGVFLFAVVTIRTSIRALYRTTALVLGLSAVGMVWFEHAATTGGQAHLIFGAASFMLAAGTAGFYAIIPRLYPEKVRATGYGLVIGVGRVGGILAPTVGGWFFHAELSPQLIFWVFAAPLALAMAFTLMLMRHHPEDGPKKVQPERESVAS
jgi:MFS family permease